MVARRDGVRAAEARAELSLTRLVDFFDSDTTALQAQDYSSSSARASLPGADAAAEGPDSGVRAGVADVLGALGPPDSIAVLEPLTKDRDRSVAETRHRGDRADQDAAAEPRLPRMTLPRHRCRERSTRVRRSTSRAS